MRYTLRDVIHEPTPAVEGFWSRLRWWWADWPPHVTLTGRRWWRLVFFEPGQGWLRWAEETRESWGGYYEPPEPYTVAPPPRRLWWLARGLLHRQGLKDARRCWRVLVDDDRRKLWK